MRRRELILLLGSGIAWPIAARAQSKQPKIGGLVPANPEPFWTGFRDGLREHGYIDGQNISFELRSADGHPERLRALADELVRLKVDVIIASLTPAVTAARQATTEIPIVMAGAADPVGTGLVSSLARPGGNITGLSGAAPERYVKVLELVRQVLPATRRVAVLANSASSFAGPLIEQLENAGRILAIAIMPIKVRGAEDFDAAFAAMRKEQTDVFMMQASLPRKPALELAGRYRLPLVGTDRLQTREGGLLSYIGDQTEMYRRTAVYVDRILKGARPADLPVEQPTRYELIINLKTASALGIKVPDTVLARAEEVIE